MGESDGAWGQLASSADDDDAKVLTEVWDGFARLPDRGDNRWLDAFLDSKHLSLEALARIGTKLANPHTLAYAFQGGIKYRNINSGERWATAGATWDSMNIVRAGASAADVVIVAEGETDGARLTMLYPEADVAILPAGAGKFTDAYAKQLASYDRVLVALDNDKAGDLGSEKIIAAVEGAIRFRPPGNDWCELGGNQDPPPLPKSRAHVALAGLTETSILPAFRGELPPPALLVDDVPLYTEGVHAVAGHPGSGKTIFALNWSVMAMVEGRHVFWFDWEAGPRQTGERLRNLDAIEMVLRERFHYFWQPDKPEDALTAIWEECPGALVVFDSASKALSSRGLDENNNSEVTSWTRGLIAASKTYMAPIVVIDHVTKSAKDSRYARGAGSKLADVDVQLMLEKVEEFDRSTQGMVSIFRAKDREAFLPLKTWWKVGDGAGRLPIVEDPDGPGNDPDEPGI